MKQSDPFKLILLLSLVVYSIGGFCQQIPTINLVMKDGLSSNYITDIAQDKYGFTWFATKYGLNRFDGDKFTVYLKEPNKELLNSNDINKIATDTINNKVWIAVIAVLVVVIAALIVVLVRRKPKDDVEKVTSEEAIQTETEATPETASDATEAATTEAQATQDCFVKVTNSNSWESANGYSGQLDSTITNKTSGALKNWEIRMTVPDKTTLDSSWNGTFKLDGTTLSVKCVDYNAEVPANGNLKDIGVIVTVPSQADLKAICDSAVLYVDGKEYKGSSASSTTEATEAKEETKPKEKIEPESGTPVDNHGKLTLKGTDIVDKGILAPVQRYTDTDALFFCRFCRCKLRHDRRALHRKYGNLLIFSQR